MAKIETEVATLSANVKNIAERMDRFQGFIGTYVQNGDIFRIDTSKALAVMIENQNDFKKYIDRCDTDRSSHEKRITSCEGFQGRLTKLASYLTVVASGVGGTIGGIIEWIRHSGPQ